MDNHYMRHALNLARRGLGRMEARPSVGCVLVKEGRVVGAGRTGDGGRPHAEIAALRMAGPEAQGATAYVTLEPCSHQGRSGPCADALIEAGLARVVVACLDPNPKVNGQGVDKLKASEIKVETGVLEGEAKALNKGFFLTLTENRPFVTLKCATSADGKLAAAKGQNTQITGKLANLRTHLERSRHEAILVGSETALVDKPQLTTRIPGLEHNSLRVVLDRRGRVKNSEFLVFDSPALQTVLAELVRKGVTRVLVEGGAQILTAFLEAGYADRFLHFKAPHEIGPQGVDALNGYLFENLSSDFGLEHKKAVSLGEDLLEIHEKDA